MVKSAIQASNLADFSADYNLNPFALRLEPLIAEVLAQVKKDQERQGTKLVSSLVVWLVLAYSFKLSRMIYDKACSPERNSLKILVKLT